MAVYHITFDALAAEWSKWIKPPQWDNFGVVRPGKKRIFAPNSFGYFKELIDSSNDWFIFIITKSRQLEKWNKFLKDYDLEKYVVWEMPDFVTNQVHEHVGRNIKVYLLKGNTKHEA